MVDSEMRILEAAIELFGRLGIEDVSITQITRLARVSNTTFYKHFHGKNALVERIFELGIERLDKELKVKGFSKSSKLTRLIEDYVFFVAENVDICRILHEAEFTYTKLPLSIKNVLMSKMAELRLPSRDELFWFMWGSTRFVTMWCFFWKHKCEDEMFQQLMEFIEKGIDPNAHELDKRVFDIHIQPVEIDIDTTKVKLLASAEKLFGERGFKKTQISDITRKAGLGLGTFYVYYETKREILKELVSRINSTLRYTLKNAVSHFKDRRDAEIAGYNAFLRFFSVHGGVYRIVREAEFVLPDAALSYYKKIYESYVPPLQKAIEKEQINPFDPSYLAVFLMGIGHFMGEDLLLVEKRKKRDFSKPLKGLAGYLFKGLGG